MRITSCILSLSVHLLLVLVSIYYPQIAKEPSIDLDKPVQEIELVQVQDTPAAKERQKKQLPEKEKAKARPEQERIESKAEKVEAEKDREPKSEKKSEPKPEPKPDPVPEPEEKPQPEPKPEQEPEPEPEPKSEPKPEPEPEPEKEPKPEAKAGSEAETPAEPGSEAEDKPEVEEKDTSPSAEEVLADAMSEVEKDIREKKKKDKELLNKALAQLKKQSQKSPAGKKSRRTSSYTREIYARILEEKIKENWSYPVFGSEENLQTEVKIFLNEQGNISNFSRVQKSGNKEFDRSVLRAIKATENIPAPPNKDLQEISITFNLQENK